MKYSELHIYFILHNISNNSVHKYTNIYVLKMVRKHTQKDL